MIPLNAMYIPDTMAAVSKGRVPHLIVDVKISTLILIPSRKERVSEIKRKNRDDSEMGTRTEARTRPVIMGSIEKKM